MGDFLGTPQYASPEQLSGDDEPARHPLGYLQPRLDVVVPAHGAAPVLRGGRWTRCSASRCARRRRRSCTPRNVPGPVIALLGAMLAADPAKRPQIARRVARRPAPLPRTDPGCGRVPAGGNASRPVARPRTLRLAQRAAVYGARSLGPGWRSCRRVCRGHRENRLVSRSVATTANAGPAPPPSPEKSIAVLPFSNLSTDKDNAFFTEGVQDEILTELAKVADLKVISRTSVMQYKSDAPRNLREIADQLSVANVVEGSVQRAGNKIRVTAQLINARTDTHLWAEHYDRDLSDIFTIQSEIAQAIADQLRAQHFPAGKSRHRRPAHHRPASLRSVRAGAGSLPGKLRDAGPRETAPGRGAARRRPRARPEVSRPAWCLLARVHGDRYFGGDDHTPERLAEATKAVQGAVALQPDAGETHLALADYYYHGFRDYTRARSELDLARQSLPNNPEICEYTGYIDRRQNRWTEAIRNLQRALELDPRNFFTLQQTGLTYQSLHRYAEVARTYDRALAIVPKDPGIRIYRAYCEIHARADVKPFQTTLAALLAEDPRVAPYVDDPNFALCERTPAAAARVLASYPREGSANMGANYPHAYWEGLVARWQGDVPRAQSAFTAARAEVAKVLAVQPDLAPALSVLGMIDAGLGHKDQAVAEGRRASELLPVSKDALAGMVIAVNLAQTLAWSGETSAALDQIAAIEREPNELTYGLLKLHPKWDDLRGDPRFTALVDSLASAPGY